MSGTGAVGQGRGQWVRDGVSGPGTGAVGQGRGAVGQGRGSVGQGRGSGPGGGQ